MLQSTFSRFSTHRMILAGIWFGPGKPSMTTFLAPFREQINSLKKDGKIHRACNCILIFF